MMPLVVVYLVVFILRYAMSSYAGCQYHVAANVDDVMVVHTNTNTGTYGKISPCVLCNG